MWVGLLAIVLALTPPTSQPATTQASNPAIEQVESLLAGGDRAGAIRAFYAVDPASPRSIEVRAQINQAADELLDEVDKLIAAKNYAAAADRLSDLLMTMSGLPTASLARQRLAELCSRPEIQQQFKLKDHAAQGEAALADARHLRDDGKEDEAYARFQSVARDYAGTPAGTEAADAVNAFESDAKFIRRMKDRAAEAKARPVLNLADNYRSAGRIDQAIRKYHEVIDQFPGTTFAETAQAELDKLK
jgi:outer membrane protein assembly factor BamD (BamD/ComL family)